ncbi:alpha/beta hydrolase [Actinoplanes sp. NPDC023936]|uniref:alpha/beta hydrolase n=1 Tax=Actinoplanes sp. NPDC023936 TaxID=3154910 RepID=UPI00340EE2B9
MNRSIALTMAGVMAALVAATPPAAAAARPRSTISWQPCPAYSDEALDMMVPPDLRDRFEQLLGRLECGTISVPLDHTKPRGRKITVALTRLRAADQAHRLGSIALNPGGPGGSGYLMPVQLLTQGAADGLNDRYDLIGFDPRGVGYSTTTDCPDPDAGDGSDPIGPLTKSQARARYAAEVRANAACGRSDPAFLARLTTADVARDLDLIRAGLGERKLGFLGVSWGTWLGVVYRSLFPTSVSRMFLDSVAIPDFSVVAFEDGRAAAAERNARRMTAWLAERDDRYRLGSTAQQVSATIVALRADYDANPRAFPDLPITLDGSFVAVATIQDAPVWPLAGQVLQELREATGPAAPPTVKEVIGEPPSSQPEPPADLPERGNRTMNRAAFCNEDPSRLGFDAAWAAYQRRLADNPLTGRALGFSAGCAGWPLPVQTVDLERGGGSLVLSGHRWETPSPYEWTWQTKAIVGGRVYTVDDDVHGSVLQEPDCAADVVGYFGTGRIDGGCAGVPVPADAARTTAAAGTPGGFRIP